MEYKVIKDFPMYGITEDGTVLNLVTERTRKVERKKDGYLRVNLSRKGKATKKYLHILVYETWKGVIPEGMQVDHKDEDKENCHADNLQLLTPKQNTCKSVKQKSCPTLVKNGKTLKVTRPLTDFSKKHGFHNASLNKVLTGHYQHHQGWRLL